MSRTRKTNAKNKTADTIRCAIYTRKSTSEGLDQAFNSLDAQRESCEAFVASQKHEGWQVLKDRYDDGGFSGGTIERPAMQRLLDDIEAGKIDCVVVYKVDRLSRSLLDFAQVMKRFEVKSIHFVSVTQHFNTADSMGRLTLNILFSFAQFEREIIAERTRDKIAAARRKGKWMGGWPVLGFDLDRSQGRLDVNQSEAKQVRAIFALYLKHESLIQVAEDANGKGWRTKSWTTATGKTMGGSSFDKCNINHLLTNVLYLGKVRYHEEVYEGEHDAIVDQSTWDRVRKILDRNARTKGAIVRNKYGALLKGLLRCMACDAAMIHSIANRGHRQHRYYVCTHAQKRGHAHCSTKSVRADAIERAVLDELRRLPIDRQALGRSDIAEAVNLFGVDPCPRQTQAQWIRLLIDQVSYDGRTGRLNFELTEELAACIRASA